MIRTSEKSPGAKQGLGQILKCSNWLALSGAAPFGRSYESVTWICTRVPIIRPGQISANRTCTAAFQELQRRRQDRMGAASARQGRTDWLLIWMIGSTALDRLRNESTQVNNSFAKNNLQKQRLVRSLIETVAPARMTTTIMIVYALVSSEWMDAGGGSKECFATACRRPARCCPFAGGPSCRWTRRCCP